MSEQLPEPTQPSEPDELTKGPVSKDDVMTALRRVVDPEIHENIVDLGLVYNVEYENDAVHVEMTLTSPACPYGPMILHDVKESVKGIGIDEVNIEVVWDPPWGPEKMTEEIRLELGFDL